MLGLLNGTSYSFTVLALSPGLKGYPSAFSNTVAPQPTMAEAERLKKAAELHAVLEESRRHREAAQGLLEGYKAQRVVEAAAAEAARHKARGWVAAAQHGDLARLRELHGGDSMPQGEPLRGFEMPPQVQQEVAALHAACTWGHLECAQWILSDPAGPKVEVLSLDGYQRNALHHAAMGGHPEVCRWLLGLPQGGQMSQATTVFGHSPAQLAGDNGHTEVAQLCRRGEEGAQNAKPWTTRSVLGLFADPYTANTSLDGGQVAHDMT